jgi:hypothetical protein
MHYASMPIDSYLLSAVLPSTRISQILVSEMAGRKRDEVPRKQKLNDAFMSCQTVGVSPRLPRNWDTGVSISRSRTSNIKLS